MVLYLLRYSDNGESTQGLLFIDNKFFCHTLEDTHREIKVPGETRIPEGLYQVGFREAITALTERYRRRFDWFDRHIEIKNIENFEAVYIHSGNSRKDTEGCPLLQDKAGNNSIGEGFNPDSIPAYKRFYETVSAALNAGEPVEILIGEFNPGQVSK